MLWVSTEMLKVKVSRLLLICFVAAFSSCSAEVALGVELSPETASFHQTATSAQPLSLYHSSPHQGTAVHFNSTGSLKTTHISHRTTVQTTDQHQVTTAADHHTTAQAGATTIQVTGQKSPVVVSTTSADNTTAAGQATTQAIETVTPAVKNTTIHPTSSTKQARTHVSTEMTAAATNTTIKHTRGNTQMTAAALTTIPTTRQTVKPTTGSGNQTTAPKSPTATAMINTTTIRPGTQTTIPSTMMTVRPTLAPQPSPIPTGTYTVSNGNRTCIKAVMGLQLMAQYTQKVRWKDYKAELCNDCFFISWNLFFFFQSNFQTLACMIKVVCYQSEGFSVPQHLSCCTLACVMMSMGRAGTFLFQ